MHKSGERKAKALLKKKKLRWMTDVPYFKT